MLSTLRRKFAVRFYESIVLTRSTTNATGLKIDYGNKLGVLKLERGIQRAGSAIC